MANDKKPEGAGKAAPKVETTTLKVLIHCQGCRKQVKKTLFSIEGVRSVEVDAALGKVTVTGTFDSKILIKKLDKAGKFAEPFASGGKSNNQVNDNKNKEEENGENVSAEKNNNNDKGNSGGGESGKKKKGGGAMNTLDDIVSVVNKSIIQNGAVKTGYISIVDYATNMFSEENADGCCVM
ncbi:hypothetical protein L7F22_058921 [Adiantum nelumboides]|nr:hypothetical protein [Adiantum nelumboides]